MGTTIANRIDVITDAEQSDSMIPHDDSHATIARQFVERRDLQLQATLPSS